VTAPPTDGLPPTEPKPLLVRGVGPAHEADGGKGYHGSSPYDFEAVFSFEFDLYAGGASYQSRLGRAGRNLLVTVAHLQWRLFPGCGQHLAGGSPPEIPRLFLSPNFLYMCQ